MKIDLLDTPQEDVRLELVPLIDVIFCILTFFILAAVGLTQQQAIDLDLPAAQTGQPLPGQTNPQPIPERLYVSIDAIGQVYLDQQPVTLDLLYDVLLQHQQVAPNGLIILYASRDARYEDVVTVLDLLRSVGGDRVALATLPKDAGSQLDPTQPQVSPDGAAPGQPPTSPLSPAPSDAPLTPFNPSQPPLQEGDDLTAPASPTSPQPSAPLTP
jgi:biopolymer transport protein ExbD